MFFFFQAEDGIRDIGVTGVQTCALPISQLFNGDGIEKLSHVSRTHANAAVTRWTADEPLFGRSEERRVGKECRSRGAVLDTKNKIVGMGHAGSMLAIEGSNVPNSDASVT